MQETNWKDEFERVWDRATAAWDDGKQSPDTMFSPEDVSFLKAIGCSAQEMFDFVDDGRNYGEPDMETSRAVTEVRREYFLTVLGGQSTGRVGDMAALPAKTDEVDGIAWLPRLIEKARLKLRGEMPPDLMYGCGGDRPFVRDMNMTLEVFLRLVWESGDDDRRIIDEVKKSAGDPSLRAS